MREAPGNIIRPAKRGVGYCRLSCVGTWLSCMMATILFQAFDPNLQAAVWRALPHGLQLSSQHGSEEALSGYLVGRSNEWTVEIPFADVMSVGRISELI